MEFKEKYISTTEALTKPDPTRIKISDDAYAQAEMLDNLAKMINFARTHG